MTTESVEAKEGIPVDTSSASSLSEKSDTTDPVARQKLEQIKAACLHHDIAELRHLAELPGGFVDDAMRRMACRSSIVMVYLKDGS